MMSHIIVENVVKQGYLKKGNYGASRLSGFFRRNEVNKWFVLTIRQGVPFLEYYDTDVDVFSQQPINSFNLSSCRNVKSMGNTNPPSFCIVCPERVIELVASSRTQMVEWVNEVEASLTRLGILKNEAVEHVYTVCPAVVRKSRTSKEVSDDKETESSLSAFPTATSTSESRHSGEQPANSLPSSSSDPIPPPRSPSSRQRNLSLKPSPRTNVPSRTSSLHASSQSASIGHATPPPLPLRLFSHTIRTTVHKETVEPTVSDPKEDPSIHPVTESSNDSDFVSPEVIAELRQRRQENTRVINSISPDNSIDANSRTSPVVSKDLGIVTNRSYIESTTVLDGRKSLLQPTLEQIKISESNGFSNSSTCQDDDDDDSALILSPSFMDSMLVGNVMKTEEATENLYCAFPCQQGMSDSGSSSTDKNHPGGSVVSKPTPVPRKVLPNMYPSPGDVISESQPVLNEHNETVVSVGYNELLTSDQTFNTMLVEDDNVSSLSDNCEYECAEVKKQTLKNDYVTDNEGEKDKAEASETSQASLKLVESYSSKDENENFYGLIYDNGPPTIFAPPPPIPPLPPRHNSLKVKCEGSKSTITQELKTVSSSTDISSPASSTLPPSAFSAAASSKHRSLPYEHSVLPPLPFARKSGSNPDSLRKPLQASAFTSSGPLDIPPMLPRRTSPHSSMTSQQDQPPAVPSRNSQSFFIKRPQITGLSSNVKICGDDDTFGPKSSASENHCVSEGKTHEAGASTSASNLSRKMLLDRANSLHTVVSLKQTQAEILQTEISMACVTVTITQKAGHGIALVDWNNFPCVVGWNQKDFPSLHGKLHLGDLIFSINNAMVTNSETAQKLLKQAPSSKIEVVLHRMPYAKVFAIHRNAEGQSLGFKREGGTGEIVYVDPNGLAAQHGLTNHSQSALGNGPCNWFLTEINNRPLNLFFKENEIDHRLLAVGREISLVVQPCDFIYEIRRQFKKLKNYKNFITQ